MYVYYLVSERHSSVALAFVMIRGRAVIPLGTRWANGSVRVAALLSFETQSFLITAVHDCCFERLINPRG